MLETQVQSLGQEDTLEKGLQPPPVFLPGESPRTEKPGGLQSIGLQRVGHDWMTVIHPSLWNQPKSWTEKGWTWYGICILSNTVYEWERRNYMYIYQFSSVTQSCSILQLRGLQHAKPPCPHGQPLELAQTHVHQVGDVIQPSHPLSPSSPPAFSLSQHQSLFPWVSSSYQVDKVLEFQLQNQSFQWIFRTDFL